MRYSYVIMPRTPAAGGGWQLQLFDGDEEVGGGAFPVAPAAPAEAATWWASLDDADRAYWGELAATSPAGAYHAFRLAEAYAHAEAEAYAWLDGRETAE